MTTAKSAKTFRFPDPPEREPDDMTSFDHLDPHRQRASPDAPLGQPRNHHCDRRTLPGADPARPESVGRALPRFADRL